MSNWNDVFGVHKCSVLSNHEYNVLRKAEEDKVIEKAEKIKRGRKRRKQEKKKNKP